MRYVLALLASLLLGQSAFAQAPGALPILLGKNSNIGIVDLGNANTNTLVVTAPANVLVVVWIYDFSNNATVTSVADTPGNCGGYSGTSANATTAFYSSIWYCYITTPLTGSTITYTSNGTSASVRRMNAAYFTGISSSPNDAAVTNTATTGGATSLSVTSGTPSVAGELFVTNVGTNGQAPATPSPQKTRPPTPAATDYGIGYYVNPGKTAVTSNYTWAGGSAAEQIILGFKPK